MDEFLQRVEQAVQARQLLARGQKVLAAVSGGVDSLALLHVLHALAKRHRWKIFVAHFNHRLRGRASAADEALVRQTAAKLLLPFIGGGADVKKFAGQSKVSIEMAGRKLRHEFLAHAASERGIPTIALAHHADDQVELFFLRLLRGAGGEGLAGMKWRSPSPARQAVSLVRPLLGFSKAELWAYARAHRLRFREDATNSATDFLRNRIRHELLPLLRKAYQPGLDQAVLRLMDIVGAEAEFVSAEAKKLNGMLGAEVSGPEGDERKHENSPPSPPGRGRSGCGVRTESGVAGSRVQCGSTVTRAHPSGRKFAELPLAIQRRLVQQQLVGLGLLPDFELVEQLRLRPEKAVSVCAGLSVTRDAAGKIRCREQGSAEFSPAQVEVTLTVHPGEKTSAETVVGAPVQGEVEFGGRKFRWRVELRRRFELPREKLTGESSVIREYFDADKIGGEMVLRHWRPGDRFQPIGLKSAVKLQDLFVNAKIPAMRRRELVLATTKADAIFWVEGLRIGEQFKLTPQTRRRLAWLA